ncbi:MAG: Glutamine cyclotransferase [Verrucomicrobiales bacterium]|nr:Glutamine cyclotransferase [Verrucomicrobiales bacterium]
MSEIQIQFPMKSKKRRLHFPEIALIFLFLGGCGRSVPTNSEGFFQSNVNISAVKTQTVVEPTRQSSAITNDFTVYAYDVINVWPHDRNAFTQGLVYRDGTLLESTGLNGQSSLRKVDLVSGKVLKQVKVSTQFFAEGLAALNGKLYQLTWQNQKGFVYDQESFQLEKEFTYEGEGWGLTTDGQSLILSDGTDRIRFLDPASFEVKRTINVQARHQPVTHLNELEYIKGEIFANIWVTDEVARIDPATGRVVGVIDFTGLLAPEDRDETTDVLNGIAYDAVNDRLFVTGKRWPKLFEVRLRVKQ